MRSADNQVKLELIADPKGLKPGFDEAENKFKAHQERLKQASQAQAELNRENVRFVERLKEQAATLGMNRSELERWRASQLQMTVAQRQSVEASLAQIDAYEKQQVSLQRVAQWATRAGAAMGAAAVAAVAMSVRVAAEAERSEAKLSAMHRATGMTSGFSRAELGSMVNDLSRRTTYGDDQVRDATSVLMSYRGVSGDTFREAMQMATGLSELMGRDLSGAAHTLGRALEDPVGGLNALTRAGVKFTEAQKDLIKEYVEHGRHAEAVAIVLERLRQSGFAAVAEEVNKPGGYTRSISDAGKATNKLLETIGGLSVIKTPVTGSLDAITRSLTNVKQVIENGTWWEKMLAMAPIVGPNYLAARTPGEAGEDEVTPAEQAERERARGAAADEAWQRGYDAQQRQLREWIKKREKQLAAEAKKRKLPRHFREDFWEEENISLGVADQAHIERQRQGGIMFNQALYGADIDLAQQITERDESLVYTVNRAGEAVAVTREEFARMEKDVVKVFSTMGAEGTRMYEDLIRASEGWGRASSQAAATMLVDFKFSSDAVRGILRQIAIDMNQMWIQRQIMNPFMDQASRGFPALFGSRWDAASGGAHAPEGMGTGMFDGSEVGGWLHSGGMWFESRRASMPSSWFAGAPRLHRGYDPGSEFPAVIRKDEEVITTQDPRHRWNGGGAPRVTIINNSRQPVAAEVEQQFDAEGAVTTVVLRDLETGGPIRDRIERMGVR